MPPNSVLKEFKSSLKPIFGNISRNDKDLYLVGHFSINVVEYENKWKWIFFSILRFKTV